MKQKAKGDGVRAKQRKRVKLSDEGIKAMKAPEGGRRDVWDALVPGLVLRVGGRRKSWAVRVEIAGKRKRVKLGVFPALTLYDARAKATAALTEAANGRDPSQPKLAEGELAFEALLDRYEAEAIPKLGPRTGKEWLRLIATEIRPRLAGLDLAEIKGARRAIRASLDEIVKRDAPSVAVTTWKIVRRIISWGVERDYVDPAAAGIIAKLEKPADEESRDRVYSAGEVRRILAALELEPGPHRLYWRLLWLTVQRREEVLTMRFDQIDFEAATWKLRIKGDKSQLVPFSTQAMELIKAARTLAAGPYVIEGAVIGEPLRNVQKSADRMRTRTEVEDFRIHDIRRTAASMLGEAGVEPHIISRLLGHAGVGPGVAPVTGVYLRARLIEPMREALQLLADKLDEIARKREG